MNYVFTFLVVIGSVSTLLSPPDLKFTQPPQHAYYSSSDGLLYYMHKDSLYSTDGKKVHTSISIYPSQALDDTDFIVSKGMPYFIQPAGGYVYGLQDTLLSRIDNLYLTKNQLKANTFLYKDRIFKFGGYGPFGTKNFFTTYSETSKDWEIYDTGEGTFAPPGLYDAKFFLIEDDFYVFGGFTLPDHDFTSPRVNNELWHFSFETNTWEMVHTFEEDLPSYSAFDFLHDDIFYYVQDQRLHALDINNASLTEYKPLSLFSKINMDFPAFVNDGQLYFLCNDYNKANLTHAINSLSLSSFEESSTHNFNQNISLPLEYIGVGSIALILIVVLGVYFKSDELKLSNRKLYYKFNKIKLTKKETIFLEYLLSQDEVPSSVFLEALTNDFDQSHKARLKNKIIDDINIKLDIITNYKYRVEQIRSEDDKRYYNYVLTKGNFK